MVKFVALALLAVTATAAAAQQSGMAQAPVLLPGETLLQVMAQGTAKAVPNVATLSTSVISDGGSAEAARAKNAEVVASLIAATLSAGVPEAALRTEALRLGPRFKPDKDGDDTKTVIGFRAETRLKIRLTDLTLVSRVFDALSAAGATGLDGPAFSFADDAPLRTRARAGAVAAAQAQANDYAKPFGLHVARVLRISERSARSDESNDIMVTARKRSGRTPEVLPGEQEVSADVWIDYALTR